LIDLTRRNRLLNAPLEGKRPWCMAITGQTPDELFSRLYRQDNFRGYAFKAREDEQQLPVVLNGDQQTSSAKSTSTKRPFLQTRLASDKLDRRLAKIFREERTLEERGGPTS
jgi:hypothetical protein